MQHDHLYSIYFIPPGSLSFRLYNLPLAQTHTLRRPLVHSTHAFAPFPTHPDVPLRPDLFAVKESLIPLTGLELFHPRLVHGFAQGRDGLLGRRRFEDGRPCDDDVAACERGLREAGRCCGRYHHEMEGRKTNAFGNV